MESNKHLDDALESGKITLEQHGVMSREAKLHPLVREIKYMPETYLMKVWGVASPEERDTLRPHMRRKIAASEHMTTQRKYALLGQLK